MKNYLIAEIQKREAIRKGVSKYIAAFNYFKTLIILSATSVGISFFF